jgi:hypothetical protein
VAPSDPRAAPGDGNRPRTCHCFAAWRRSGSGLAAIPDSDELRAADEAIVHIGHNDGDEGARQFPTKIDQMAELYRSGQHRLDLAKASPAELLAFCVAVEIEAWGSSGNADKV